MKQGIEINYFVFLLGILDPPKEEMNIDPPMYQEITKVINYMRSSPSA